MDKIAIEDVVNVSHFAILSKIYKTFVDQNTYQNTDTVSDSLSGMGISETNLAGNLYKFGKAKHLTGVFLDTSACTLNVQRKRYFSIGSYFM